MLFDPFRIFSLYYVQYLDVFGRFHPGTDCAHLQCLLSAVLELKASLHSLELDNIIHTQPNYRQPQDTHSPKTCKGCKGAHVEKVKGHVWY